MSLRELVEQDLAQSLEDQNEWGLPVVLVAPDGVVYDTSVNDPTKALSGQVLYDTLVDNPETGGEMIVHKPVVTLRRSSLARVPAAGETWMVKIPTTPSTTASLETFFLDYPSEEGGSIGFIRLYLTKTKQS